MSLPLPPVRPLRVPRTEKSWQGLPARYTSASPRLAADATASDSSGSTPMFRLNTSRAIPDFSNAPTQVPPAPSNPKEPPPAPAKPSWKVNGYLVSVLPVTCIGLRPTVWSWYCSRSHAHPDALLLASASDTISLPVSFGTTPSRAGSRERAHPTASPSR